VIRKKQQIDYHTAIRLKIKHLFKKTNEFQLAACAVFATTLLWSLVPKIANAFILYLSSNLSFNMKLIIIAIFLRLMTIFLAFMEKNLALLVALRYRLLKFACVRGCNYEIKITN
jgi:hypothetical protein